MNINSAAHMLGAVTMTINRTARNLLGAVFADLNAVSLN